MANWMNTTFITDTLAAKLSEISDHSVTTIVAPIGYGKSRAVRWWGETCQIQKPRVRVLRQVIVTNSLADFWHGFCRNLRGWPRLEQEMTALGFPTEPQTRELMLELLCDALSAHDDDIFYVIDDLHFLPNPAFAAFILFLSDRLPERIHIVLISRNRIFDRAARMKLGHNLLEIKANDLRLDGAAIQTFAARGGLMLSDADAGQLARSTEGWFSMVYLAIRSYVETGRWPEHTSNIYPLVDEVLFQPLPERPRQFLIRMGVPDSFTTEQARFLWPHDDVEELLTQLTEQNAFVTVSDGVYIYHNMLRSCARARFDRLSDAERSDFRYRLGQWYERNRSYYLAELCYAECGAWADLLRAFYLDHARSITGENLDQMLDWLNRCPEEIWQQNPDAMVVMLRKLFSFSRISEMLRMRELLLTTLERRTDLDQDARDNYRGEVELCMSFLAYNDISAMSAYHRRACALLTRPAVGMMGGNLTFGVPSVLMQYHRTAGKLDHENQEMRECMPYFYQVSNGLGNGAEHVMQGETDFCRGKLLDAELSYRLAVGAARRQKQADIWVAADFLKAQMELLNGDFDGAEQRLADQEELLRREFRYELLYSVELCRGWLYGLLGQPGEHPLWLTDESILLPMMRPASAMVEITRNLLLLARRDWIAVVAREQTVKEACNGYQGMLLCSIWAELELAAAFSHLGRQESAVVHLKNALEWALPDGILMPLVFLHDHLGDCLPAVRMDRQTADRLRELCESYRTAKASILRERFPQSNLEAFDLTERELEIVRLIARRMTRREIGTALGITEKTVSNRLTVIYEKLGLEGTLQSRRQALIALLETQKN